MKITINRKMSIIAFILGMCVTFTSTMPIVAAEAFSTEASAEMSTEASIETASVDETHVTNIAQTAATTAFADAIATGKDEDVALYEAKKAANSEVERLTGTKVIEPEPEDQVSENSEEASDETDDCADEEVIDTEENSDDIQSTESEESIADFEAEQASMTAIERASSVTDTEIVVTDEEMKLLATIIFCEAGNQSHVGKVAVGNVVLNRLRSERFPNTLSEVIYQRGQFTPAGTGWLNRELNRNNVTADCYAAAKEALEGSKPVGNALFFMRKSSRSNGIIIGAHCFW